MNNLKLEFKGLLKSPASWARVNRELLVKLADIKQISLAIQPCRGFLWSKDFSIPNKLKKLFREHTNPDCRLMFAYPPALKKYNLNNNIPLWNLSVYEATQLPPGWVQPLNKFCDQVIIPSTHVRDAYARSGVEEEILQVVPYGFNEELIEKYSNTISNIPKNKNLNLITIATPHRRKGLDIIEKCSGLLERYSVNWHVHSPYRVNKKNSQFWENPDILKKLNSSGFKISREPVSDEKIIQILSEADLCIQPSRSEGFGLVILEAMAAGTPVVTSNWGGPLDFAGHGMIKVSGEIRAADSCQYDKKHPEAKVFEPDRDQLQKTITRLIKNPKKIQSLGKKAQKTVKNLTWKNSARQLTNALKKKIC